MNLTVVAGGAGNFILYSGNAVNPGTSSLNFTAGRVRTNNAILQLSTDGSGTIVVINSSADANHLILDVNGYFE